VLIYRAESRESSLSLASSASERPRGLISPPLLAISSLRPVARPRLGEPAELAGGAEVPPGRDGAKTTYLCRLATNLAQPSAPPAQSVFFFFFFFVLFFCSFPSFFFFPPRRPCRNLIERRGAAACGPGRGPRVWGSWPTAQVRSADASCMARRGRPRLDSAAAAHTRP